MGQRRVLWRLAVLALLGAVSGCGMPPNRPEFADRMARNTRKLMLLAIQYRAAVMPIAKPGPNVDETINGPARELHKKMEEEVRTMRAEYAKDCLPSKPSASAPAYLEAFRKFLDAQDAIVKQPLRDVMGILEDPSTPRASKWGLIQAKFSEVKSLELEAHGPVRMAGEAYAKEHKFRLISERQLK